MNDTFVRAAVGRVVSLSEADMTLLLRYAQRLTLKKRELLLPAGARCRSFYLVEYGYLRVFAMQRGVVTNLRFALENAFITNMHSFRTGLPTTTTLEAGEAASIWVLHVRSLLEREAVSSQLARFIRRVALDVLLESETHADMLRLSDAPARYRYLEQHHPALLQRVPLVELASYLGVARETLSRIRARPAGAGPEL